MKNKRNLAKKLAMLVTTICLLIVSVPYVTEMGGVIKSKALGSNGSAGYDYVYGSKDGTIQSSKNMIENGVFSYEFIQNDMYEKAKKNGYSKEVVAQLVEEGYLAPYVDELISLGKLPDGYTVGSSTTSTTETTTATTENQTTVSEPNYTVEDYAATMYVAGTETLNVRSGAGVSYSAMGTLLKGAEVSVTGKTSNNWYRISYKDTEGYVSGKYLKTEQESTVTVTETTATEVVAEANAELPELPTTHDFDTLDLATNSELSKFMGDMVADDDYVNIPVTAEKKELYATIANLTTTDKVSAIIHFTDENGTVVYSYEISDWNDEKTDAVYDLTLTNENNTITLSDSFVLKGKVKLTVKAEPKTEYTVLANGTSVLEDTSSEDGYLTFSLVENVNQYTLQELTKEETEETKETVAPTETETVVETEVAPVEESKPNILLIVSGIVAVILVIGGGISYVSHKKML